MGRTKELLEELILEELILEEWEDELIRLTL